MTKTVLFDKLLKLRLPAFRDGLREQQNNPQYIDLTFEERLAFLVDQECTRRLDNHIRTALHKAGFLIQAAPEDLDFSSSRGLDHKQIHELYQCDWVGSHLNILVLGPTGSGKSFIACSLGTAAIRLGFSVRYFHTSRLLHTLEHSRKDASYSNLLRIIARTDLLILLRLDARSAHTGQCSGYSGNPR